LHSLNLPSPIQKLDGFHPSYTVWVKREDLIHPKFGGNKWRKLKFNLEKFQKDNHDLLVTFGGPFSNHIAATSAACRHYKVPSIGIVRGEYEDNLNPTLAKAKQGGMTLHHVSKDEYKLKEESIKFKNLIQNYRNPLIVPEGGQNQAGILGAQELGEEINESRIAYDYVFVSGGTGTTAIGLIKGLDNPHTVVINALKNPSLDQVLIEKLKNKTDWEVNHDYHFGGFAKTDDTLQNFAQEMYRKYNLFLDPIYNAKSLYGLFQMCKTNKLDEGSKILYIHTGGLQGIAAWNYSNNKKWLDTKI